MQIVIDVPDRIYKIVQNKTLNIIDSEIVEKAITNGTLLPKHGRIMDVDEIIKKMEEREERLKDDRSMYETSCVETAIDMFGETIIEADMESEVEE